MATVAPTVSRLTNRSRRWSGALCLTGGVVLLALARNLLAHRWSVDAAAIQVLGYSALLLVSLSSVRLAGLSREEIGLFSGHITLRLGGVAFLLIVLGAPDLRHGISAHGLLAALPGAMAVATIEELLFRGVLFAIWERLCGTTGAAMLTSGAFALAHVGLYPPSFLLLGLVVGLLLGSWRASTGDLVAPVVAHGLADALANGLLGASP